MIYFIECMGFVKIGKAENVARRLSELQIGNQHELRLLGVIDAPDDEEARLHAAFWSFHYRGEWFHLTKAIKEFIDREGIKDETKDLDDPAKLAAASFDQWSASQLIQDDDSRASLEFLHNHHIKWCKKNDLPACEDQRKFSVLMNQKDGPVRKFGVALLKIGRSRQYPGIGLVSGEREDRRTGTQKKADEIADILKAEFQKNGGCPIEGSTVHSIVKNAGFSVGGALYLAVERSGIRIEKTPAMTTPNLWHAPATWLS